MRSMRGRISMGVIALVIFLAAIMDPPGAAAAPSFPDLTGHWSRTEVLALVDLGVVTGYPDGSFRPDQYLGRAEFYALLVRSLKKPLLPGDPLIAVPKGHWAVPAVNALVQAGILRAEDTYDLDASISRGEIARLIARSQGWSAYPENTYLTDLGTDAPAISSVLSHGIFTGYPDRTFRPGNSTTRAEAAVVLTRLINAARRPPTWRERYVVTVGGETITMNLVRANLRSPRVKPRVALARDQVGATEALADIADRPNVMAAINGSYFQAYDSSIPMESYGTIYSQGKMIQTGWFRSAIGFWSDGTARIDPMNASVDGTGASGTWDTYWGSHGLNRYARPDFGENWVVVYTPEHGRSTGITGGTSVLVRNGKVTQITSDTVPIPADGYLIHLNGTETALAGKVFQVGKPAAYRTLAQPEWDGVQELVQAGPRLVKDGTKQINFQAERFTERKITTDATPRSAVALTADGQLLLIQTPSATVHGLADALVRLGVRDAMCLDSGGSSGLYYDGTEIARPGRAVANALVVEVR